MSGSGTTVSAYNATGWKPSGSKIYKYYRANLAYSWWGDGWNETTYYVSAVTRAELNSSVTAYFSGSASATYYGASSGTANTVFEHGNIATVSNTSRTYSYSRTTYPYTVYAYGTVWSDKQSWKNEKVTATAGFTVPALSSHTVAYNLNGGSGTTPSSQTKYYSINISVYNGEDPTKSGGYVFSHWNTAQNGSGTTYNKGVPYAYNQNGGTVTLYAQYTVTNPPTFEDNDVEDFSDFVEPTTDYSEIGTTITGIEHYEGRYISSITLTWGSDSQTLTYTQNNQPSDEVEIKLTPRSSGTHPLVVTIEDNAGASTPHTLGGDGHEVTVVDPTWTYVAEYSTSIDVPNNNELGNADITVYALNKNTNTYDTITQSTIVTVDKANNKWSFPINLTWDYVDDTDQDNPSATIKIDYDRQDSYQSESRRPFFSTTRNANFSTGISNTMFISGAEYPNYTSRVWWSEINNPLYFPDLNYIEVGSNDTSVMGLCKVGDYLGVVKQSKTTDTAIFLVYPTSFEDNTTYAVKQLTSGIGAIGKYAFNVLGDETLFLSPDGVMAIVAGEDNDHKIQNRSYFIDGKLLKESNLENAYSFVFESKYYLALNDHCYVLDGNQRNSWGNDKTNLVYECYYLENVPANCFVKHNEQLYFSNDDMLCKVKDRSAGDAYTDAMSVGVENAPVKARWSTILDDDGALNYYKTMQKKGNAISIFPNDRFTYTLVTITEEEFNAHKTNYFTLVDGVYVRCRKDSVYDQYAEYYIRDKSSTRIYIRKDNNDPVEINREFNEATEIPSELFVNKKFKKYKRLQFIIENNEAEPFGVDSIVKQYTVGNYAKR